jgi:hypothetical protein
MTEQPETPDVTDDEPQEAHLEAAPYDESERVAAPDWYDDTINVGDVANAADPDGGEGA